MDSETDKNGSVCPDMSHDALICLWFLKCLSAEKLRKAIICSIYASALFPCLRHNEGKTKKTWEEIEEVSCAKM